MGKDKSYHASIRITSSEWEPGAFLPGKAAINEVVLLELSAPSLNALILKSKAFLELEYEEEAKKAVDVSYRGVPGSEDDFGNPGIGTQEAQEKFREQFKIVGDSPERRKRKKGLEPGDEHDEELPDEQRRPIHQDDAATINEELNKRGYVPAAKDRNISEESNPFAQDGEL